MRFIERFGTLITIVLALVALMSQTPADTAWNNLRTYVPDWFLNHIWWFVALSATITALAWLSQRHKSWLLDFLWIGNQEQNPIKNENTPQKKAANNGAATQKPLVLFTNLNACDQAEITITKVRFDPNGPKVFYIHFTLDNLGDPTVLRKWLISIKPVDSEAFFVQPERIFTKYTPELNGPGIFEDLSITPLEKGGSRNGYAQYTHHSDIFPFQKAGTIFRLSVMDIRGRELRAEYRLIEDADNN